ncbi:hydrogen peroxide-inducible genes activator [Bauldia sp.]|uniref:hydrogen peroxide-inducible genes activator n=1 Tax=Bauldia sp. TaxID=2575872 RepID=UPI003BAAE022
MISLKQLRYFDLLAATGHFGRAADRAGVSQPALSMQVRELERALDGRLVEREPGGARLTPLGEEVARRTASILSEVRDLESLADIRGGLLSGPIRLGIIPSVAPFLLPPLLKLIESEHPDLELTIRETVTEALVEELASGRLDVVIASLPLERDDLEEAEAFEDRFLLAASEGTPHAARTPALADLIEADELLLLEDGHCFRDQALSVCHAIDPARLRSFGATSFSTLLQLVAAGHGVTLLPEMAVAAGIVADPRLRLNRFARPEPSRTIGVAWRRRSPRADDYRALAERVAEAAGGASVGGAT